MASAAGLWCPCWLIRACNWRCGRVVCVWGWHVWLTRDPWVVPKPAKWCWEVTQATPWEVGALIGHRGGYVCDLCFWPAFGPPEAGVSDGSCSPLL